jgi:SAM-dependent methyltransferase
MTFDVAAESYDRFMGRYSRLLSPQMADLAGVETGAAQRVVDVGCGPGVLTGELVARVGAANVAAADPSKPFVAAARVRYPGVDVREAPAEDLPFEDGAFDTAIAQLVVHFMSDPVAGLGEMRRVTRSGGTVVACVWDHAGERGPLSIFWAAVRSLDPGVRDESHLPGVRPGHLVELMTAAGLEEVDETELVVRFDHPSFEEWWLPYEGGVGPPGAYLATVDEATRARVRERCRELLPEAPFALESVAWAARGRA